MEADLAVVHLSDRIPGRQQVDIEAVLCAPLGTTPPRVGLYLQDRVETGLFMDDADPGVDTVAPHFLARRCSRDEADPTLPFRRKLRADGLVGRSEALAKVLQQVARASPLNIGVLLTGPSGTGKTQIARILHDSSPRAGTPFVELNCATVTETLFESELFGAIPGAHSTAMRRAEGKVAAAEGGTLFLDEVGEIPLSAQAKLLQLLQSKEYYPLGSSRAARADVRIVAATNSDLKAAVARRTFREDLFYRLQVLPIRIPALGERREDIADLVAHFCALACETYEVPRMSLSVGALLAAEAAEWPGNVRELAHAVQAAVVRAGEGAPVIEQSHLFPDSVAAKPAASGEQLTFQQATRRFQAELVARALEDTAWNVTETAARLDLTRSHVYNLIHAFGLERRRG